MNEILTFTPPPPPPPPVARRPSSVPPATRRILVGALVAGVLTDLALRAVVVGVAGVLLIVVTSAILLASGRVPAREARLLVATAPLFGVWLCLRTSPWLIPLDVIAAGGLLFAGVTVAQGGSVFDMRLSEAALRGIESIGQWFGVPSFVAPLLPDGDRARAVAPVARGVLLAVPVVLVLGALLASADAVFASALSVDLNGGQALLHVALIGLGAWTLLWLARRASAPWTPGSRTRNGALGTSEITVVLGAVALLFASFGLSQVVTALGGADHVLDTEGLTYAEYARSGFFQLLWVAALTVGLLLALRALAAPDDRTQRRLRGLGLLVVGLTLPIVAVALRRLDLYQDAFGLTMLRLYCTLFASWVGLILIGLGLVLAGVRRDREWLPGAAVVSGLALLMVLNVINPEAFVAAHNIDRIAHGQEVDSAYLADLSLDAVPTIVDRLPSLDPATQADLVARMGCPDPIESWAAWNHSRAQALDALAPYC